MIGRIFAAALVSLFMAGGAAAGDNDELVAEGLRIAERNCGSCHALTRTGVSPHPDAPAFRTFADKWPVEQLAESLAEGMVTGHEDMPELAFEPDEIEALLAYLDEVGRE